MKVISMLVSGFILGCFAAILLAFASLEGEYHTDAEKQQLQDVVDSAGFYAPEPVSGDHKLQEPHNNKGN